MVADRMRPNVADDISKMGNLEVISFTIREGARDNNEYILNMGRPGVTSHPASGRYRHSDGDRDTAK